MSLDPMQAAGAIITGGGAVAVLIWATRGVWRMLRKISRFLDDWLGDPDDPKQPGVMKRLERIEGELTLNSGQSVKDKVNWVAEQVKALRSPI